VDGTKMTDGGAAISVVGVGASAGGLDVFPRLLADLACRHGLRYCVRAASRPEPPGLAGRDPGAGYGDAGDGGRRTACALSESRLCDQAQCLSDDRLRSAARHSADADTRWRRSGDRSVVVLAQRCRRGRFREPFHRGTDSTIESGCSRPGASSRPSRAAAPHARPGSSRAEGFPAEVAWRRRRW